MKAFIIKSLLCSLSCIVYGMQKEIELKIKVQENDSYRLLSWLCKNANYVHDVDHCEYYLTNPNKSTWNFDAGFKDTLETVRVRTTQKGDSVCYKYRHIDPITNKTTHRDEYETKIGNGLVMVGILQKLGYSDTTVIKKKRAIYTYNEFEIVFDEVENIGSFIEVELKKPVDDVKVGLKSIDDFLLNVGITQFLQFDRGYIHMAWNPGYDFGVKRNLVK